MQIGIVGIEKMGGKLLEKALKEGHEVVAWNRTKDAYEPLKVQYSDYLLKTKLKTSFTIEGMHEILNKPRIFWLMLPPGDVKEEIFEQITQLVEQGDIIIDGGNANYKDTQKRYDLLTPKGIKFLGIGIADDINSVETGFSLMAGGNKDAYEYIRPLLDSLALPEGAHNYFGQGGAGHFVKMAHNGIEYGIMQSIGEGFGVLAKSPYEINLVDVGSVWQRGSIIRSFLLDMAVKALVEDGDFVSREGIVPTTGEVKWLVEAAAEEHIAVDAIAKSLEVRQHSQYDGATQSTFAAKLIAALRKQFRES